MQYETELAFLCDTFERCYIQTSILDRDMPVPPQLDMGARALLGEENLTKRFFSDLLPPVEANTVYYMTDRFACNYLYLLLPGTSGSVLFLGPFQEELPSQQQLLQTAERLGIPPQNKRTLEKYYGSIPVLPKGSHLHRMLECFCERIWGKGQFTYEDLKPEHVREVPIKALQRQQPEPQPPLWSVKIMEKRYAHENELLEAVSQGQLHKAEALLAGYSSVGFEQRNPDPLRNLKNYCIIMNTLLRKAAQKGGVHPTYLDSVSSDFAVDIEKLPNISATYGLMGIMVQTYCRLVRKHSMKDYSAPVQKTIIMIDTDLSADLSLQTLSTALDVSASYLSSLFKRETGQTVTQYINRKRVDRAKHLLETTTLQIQTIAQHCGMEDSHYFARVFKKETGMTPNQYRTSVR